jgi:hypothetical protein
MASGYSAEQVPCTQSRTYSCKRDDPLGPGSLHIGPSLVINAGHQPCWPGQMSARMSPAAGMIQDTRMRTECVCSHNISAKTCKSACCTCLRLSVLRSTSCGVPPTTKGLTSRSRLVAISSQADMVMAMHANFIRSSLQPTSCCCTRCSWDCLSASAQTYNAGPLVHIQKRRMQQRPA